MKKAKYDFYWDEGIGFAKCTLITQYGQFTGIAQCHPDDEDMMSEKVGCEIAYSRATINSLTHVRDNVIKPSLKALKQLYYSMNRGKKYNPKSYESKMLWSQIRIWQTDLNTVNTMLATEKQDLKTYIETKEKLY